MIFDPNSRCLCIFSGMGDDDHYLSDMYSYDLDTNTATQLFVNFASSGGPDKNSTQRAVVDSSLQEIYVFGIFSPTSLMLSLNVVFQSLRSYTQPRKAYSCGELNLAV